MAKYYIKYKNEKQKIFLNANFGVEVIEIDDAEEIDNVLKNISNKKRTTIFMSDEIASFSEDIVKKYRRDKNIKIMIISWGEKWKVQKKLIM